MAALAAVSVVALSSCERWSQGTVTPAEAPSVHPGASLVVTKFLPADDLAAAGLSSLASVVTPVTATATDQGRTITLVGVYADGARTVLFFHGVSAREQLTALDVNDSQGLINAGSRSGYVTSTGDAFEALDGGSRPGPDGVAHLTVLVRDIESYPVGGGSQIVSGNWSFSVSTPIQPATALPAVQPFGLGRWRVGIEVLEVTPSVIHLQALINGGSIVQISGPGIPALLELWTSRGSQIAAVAEDASITVPKQQINPTIYQNSRITYEWPRPADASRLELRFHGDGGRYTLPISIPALQLPG